MLARLSGATGHEQGVGGGRVGKEGRGRAEGAAEDGEEWGWERVEWGRRRRRGERDMDGGGKCAEGRMGLRRGKSCRKGIGWGGEELG